MVANEIKELAKQTTHATEQIDEQVNAIRETVGTTVEEINTIATIIDEVNTISHTIVASMEEQSVTTGEISQNVSSTSKSAERVRGICEENVKTISGIFANITEVNTSAEKTEEGVQRNRVNIQHMTGAIEKMYKMVGRFKI